MLVFKGKIPRTPEAHIRKRGVYIFNEIMDAHKLEPDKDEWKLWEITWDHVEDKQLMEAVQSEGTGDWTKIALLLDNGHNADSCRERWEDSLSNLPRSSKSTSTVH